MSDTRRSFLHSTAAIATGIGGASLMAQTQQPAAPPRAASEIQVPKMKFGKYEVSRLIAGCNPFYGFSHFNKNVDTAMREYFTPDRVRAVLHQCSRFGINTFNYYPGGRGPADFESFLAEGGQMNLIIQGMNDFMPSVKAFKPMAIYCQGEIVDKAYQAGQMDTIKEWCKNVRGTGAMVGVGTHKPEVIALVEEQGWDVDFYAGCVYNRTRTTDEWKKVLGGELVEMQGDCYLQSDPPRMYKVMRATAKPCFAFKILAAGRVTNAEQAFRTAYESIKPNDGVFIGLYPAAKDEVRENAERVHRLLAGA
jgi:hypothetical protein